MITRELNERQSRLLRDTDSKCRTRGCQGGCRRGWLPLTEKTAPVARRLAKAGLVHLSKEEAAAHVSLTGRSAIACQDAPFSERDFHHGMVVEHKRSRALYRLAEPFDSCFSATLLDSSARGTTHFFSWPEACSFKKTNRAAPPASNPLDRILTRASQIRRRKR